ncbi:MAG: glycosyltransferase family 2 protein [Alphaproteobacteria bacterium]
MEDETLGGGPDAGSGSRVAVVLLNWNAWSDTIECLESLLRSDHPNFQVIVCDNASTDGSVDRLTAWGRGEAVWEGPSDPAMARFTDPPIDKPLSMICVDAGQPASPADRAARVVVLRTGGNYGFAGGNNAGLRWALSDPTFDYFWVLNNDTVQEPTAMGRMVARMEEHPKPGICGSTILYYEDPDTIQALNGGGFKAWNGSTYAIDIDRPFKDVKINRSDVERRTDMVLGASMFTSRAFLDEVGLLDERYFLFYEEIDWAMRTRGRFDHLYAPDAIIYHKKGASIGTGSAARRRGALADFYMTQSKLLFTRKHRPDLLPIIYLTTARVALVRLSRRRWRNAGAVALAMLGKKWYDKAPY